MTIRRIRTNSRMSQAVVHDATVYLSGQISLDAIGGSVGEQTLRILAQIDSLLAEVGTDKANILSATIWLTDVATFDEMNAIWDAWLPPAAAPARATVGASLALPGLKVEIAVVAAVP